MVKDSSQKPRLFNGPALFVAILREADPAFRAALIAGVRKVSPIHARLAEQCEFVFADILRLDAASVETALRMIPEADLLVAWKLASPAIRDVLSKGMTERRQKDFAAAFTALPKMHRRQVIAVQARIGGILRDGVREGRLRLRARRPNLREILQNSGKFKGAPSSHKR